MNLKRQMQYKMRIWNNTAIKKRLIGFGMGCDYNMLYDWIDEGLTKPASELEAQEPP